MDKVARCKILEKAIFKDECPLRNDQIKENDDCRKYSFNPSLIKKPKDTTKFKSSISTKTQKTKIEKQEPWRAEAIDLPQNPFTEEQYQAIEKAWYRLNPINNFDLRSKLEHAAIWYLTFRKQSAGRPRLSDIRRNLEKIYKLAGQLSDFLREEADDETLVKLGPVLWQKIYEFDDDVYRIYRAAKVELRTLPSDPGGAKQWETKAQKAHFEMIANIYEEGTSKKLKRDNDPITQKPKKEYKTVLNFLRLCLEPLDYGKNLSDSAIDDKIYYYLKPTKN